MPMVRSCALLTLFRYAAPSTLPIASNAGSAVLARRALVTSARGISMMSDAAGDELVSAISADGSISAKAIITTELVAENSRLQGLGGLAAVALGRALTCSLLVAEGVEADETFQVNFAGDGPLRGVLAIANGKLESRGYVGNPAVTLPPNALGKYDVGAGVGKGALQVVRTKNLPGEEVSTPYTSITEIQTGEIPEDINYFLCESEQKEGALAAGVYIQGTDSGPDRNGALLGGAGVQASGGWYVQLLPFADEEAVAQLQTNLAALAERSPTTMIREGVRAEDMLNLLLDGLEPQIMSRQKPALLSESCPCSDERVLRTLRLLPRTEVDDILEKHEDIEIKCEFCGKLYNLTPDEIREKLAV